MYPQCFSGKTAMGQELSRWLYYLFVVFFV